MEKINENIEDVKTNSDDSIQTLQMSEELNNLLFFINDSILFSILSKIS